MLSRHRNLIILTVVVFAQLSLLAYQSRQNQDITFIRYGTILVITPLQKSFQALTKAVRGMWFGYIDLRQARRTSEDLARELNELKLSHQRLQNEVEQARRLQALLGFQQEQPFRTVAAQVIGSTAGGPSRLLLTDRGENAGLRPDLPVIVPDGVVGKVLFVFPNAAQILLLTDTNSGVATLLESSRAHGILKGKNTTLVELAYVPGSEQVEIGEKVITSGEDGIFPKGLPVGVVVSAQPGSDFWKVEVQPLANLNRLEEVLVILHEAAEEISAVPATDVSAQASPREESPDTAPPAEDQPPTP